MGRHYFLVQTTVAPPITPPERWRQAFADGHGCHWDTLQQVVAAGDTVWLAVTHADWLDKVAALLRWQAGCRLVVLSLMPDDAEGLRAIQAGARGYCHLLAVPELLREVAQVVQLGGLWVGPELVRRLVTATREWLERQPGAASPQLDLSALSGREAQVARAVAAGKSNREVAEQLHISERTVKAHLGAVFGKLGVRDRVQLVLRLTQGLPQIL